MRLGIRDVAKGGPGRRASSSSRASTNIMRPSSREYHRLWRPRRPLTSTPTVLTFTFLLLALAQTTLAVRIPFSNCLPESYRKNDPLPLQWTPLYADAVFDTQNDSHNLQVIVWGNVSGSSNTDDLPPPGDPYWDDGDEEDGKIIQSPEPGVATTLYRRVNVLTFEPWRMTVDFCSDGLTNGSCPLSPVWDQDIDVDSPYGLPSINMTHDFFASYAFSTFSPTMIIINGDASATDIGCVSANVTPDLGGLYQLLRFLPLLILILTGAAITYMQHLDYEPVHTERPGEMIAYYKISRHYKWALDELFYKHKFSRVIILEDDMEIAPDFFEYFEAGAALMDHDKSIMAVSSWNDNGQKQFVHDPYVLYRSDFFPGLGWMLSRSTWDELSPKWPKAYWDDWLRLKENHKGRQFIRPEVCRTYNFGEHGSSMGQFFNQYLKPIKLNDVQVDWKSMDLSYLEEDKYVEHFGNLVRKATPIHGTDVVLKASNINGDVRILYRDQRDFERIASQFGIFEEWKDGVPRAAYKGVVVFRHQIQKRIFLVAPDSLQQLGMR